MRIISKKLSDRLAGIPLIALAFAVLGIQVTASAMTGPLRVYDEGILVTDAFLMSRGQIPYRDFSANYPPGSFLLARACTLLSGGATIHAMRVVALGARVAGAMLAAIVVGRLTKGRARIATFAAVLLVQSRVELTMFAYVTAVTLALGGIAALPSTASKRGRFAASGALFGLVSWFRHDLFVYGACAAIGLGLFARLARRPLVAPLPRDARRAFCLGLLCTIVPFWLPTLVLGGPVQVIHDLALDPARYVQRARLMPLPSFDGEQTIGFFNWHVPVYLADFVPLGLIFLACGIAAGATQIALQVRSPKVREDQRRTTALLLALALGTAPQALQRTDWAHVGYGVPATVACLFGALGSIHLLSEALLLLAFLPFVASRPELVAPGDLLSRMRTRRDEAFIPGERRAVSDAVQRLAKVDDRIFVGCTSHARVIINPMSIYFESQRLGSTRVEQFDPGIVTRDEVQRQMIDELEVHHPAALVLADDCFWNEPNASSEPGSERLDRYIAAHYVAVQQIGPYHVMRPR
jgi:hypothetical protein